MTLFDQAVAAWALLAAGFSWVAWFRLRPLATVVLRERWPKVLLLRPVDVPSPEELTALAGPIDYPAPLVHRVLSPARPLLPAGVEWICSDPQSRNRKVGHLLHGLKTAAAPDAVVLAIDADVRVDGALVKALVHAVLGGAALAWAAPVPEQARGLWGRAGRGLLTRTHHSFLALDAMPAGAPTVCGKAIGLSAATQALLPAVAGCIGEDLELSLRLCAAGERVERAQAIARLAGATAAGPESLARFTRWMQVLLAHRPALAPSVPLLFAPAPLLLALALATGTPLVLAATAVLVLSRQLLAVRLGRIAGANGPAWEWFLGEVLLAGAFAGALRKRTVFWRGRQFRLGPGGEMTPVGNR